MAATLLKRDCNTGVFLWAASVVEHLWCSDYQTNKRLGKKRKKVLEEY